MLVQLGACATVCRAWPLSALVLRVADRRCDATAAHLLTHARSHTLLLLAHAQAVVVLLCCIFFGMIVSNTTEPRWAGWAALLALLMMLASAAPIIQYFNT